MSANILPGHPTPIRSQSAWAKAVPDRALTEAERQQIATSVTVTANQAAEYLGITRQEFDRRKKKAGIEPAEWHRGNGPWPYALYRLADVQRLRE